VNAAEQIVKALLEGALDPGDDSAVEAFYNAVQVYAEELYVEETSIAGVENEPGEPAIAVHGGIYNQKSVRAVKGFLTELIEHFDLTYRLIHVNVYADPESGSPTKRGRYYSFIVFFKPLPPTNRPEEIAFSESLLEASAPEWVQQRMHARVKAGWNPRWPFVPVDLHNPSFRAAIQSDPELSDGEKQNILSFAPGGKNERSLYGESVAVDLDGTLAKDSGWKGAEYIGEPVQPMLDLVKKLLDDGEEVVIFTARVHDGEKSTKEHIRDWLKDHDLPDLEITNEKRPDMEKFYDDKAVAVEKNRGPA
jgi:hypothetical protein